MYVMTFSEGTELPVDRDTLLKRLLAEAPDPASGRWEPLADNRGAAMHTERASAKDPSRITTTDSGISLDPTPTGTRVQMDVTMGFGTAPAWAMFLVRPLARRRLHAAFQALILALQTGDVSALHEQRRRNARSGLRARTAQLVFYLVFAALLVAFFALVSVVLAVVVAVFFLVAASFPVRRILGARRDINA
jgi:hypothetical protein